MLVLHDEWHFKRSLGHHVVSLVWKFVLNLPPFLVFETERVDGAQALVVLVATTKDDHGVLLGLTAQLRRTFAIGSFFNRARCRVVFLVFDVDRGKLWASQVFTERGLDVSRLFLRHCFRQTNRLSGNDGHFFVALTSVRAVEFRARAVGLAQRSLFVFGGSGGEAFKLTRLHIKRARRGKVLKLAASVPNLVPAVKNDFVRVRVHRRAHTRHRRRRARALAASTPRQIIPAPAPDEHVHRIRRLPGLP